MLRCDIAIDRVHRIGQDKTVYVKHFIVRNMNFQSLNQYHNNCTPDIENN